MYTYNSVSTSPEKAQDQRAHNKRAHAYIVHAYMVHAYIVHAQRVHVQRVHALDNVIICMYVYIESACLESTCQRMHARRTAGNKLHAQIMRILFQTAITALVQLN